jgi:hypothetical protein
MHYAHTDGGVSAIQKGLAVEQVVQQAIDEFLERPIHLDFLDCA